MDLRSFLLVTLVGGLAGADLDGTWTATVDDDGGTGTLELRAEGEVVSGTYEEGGLRSPLRGRATAEGFTGQVDVAGEVLVLRGVSRDGMLVVQVQEPGEPEPLRLVFRRSGRPAAMVPATGRRVSDAQPPTHRPSDLQPQLPAGDPGPIVQPGPDGQEDGGATPGEPARPALAGGRVERLPTAGFELTIPAGLEIQRTATGLLAVDRVRGRALVVIGHQAASPAELAHLAGEMVEEDGVVLHPGAARECRHAGAAGLTVDYRGTANGAPAEGVGIALRSPRGPGGPALILVVRAGGLDAETRSLFTGVADSLRFSSPTSSPLVAQAKGRLAGRVLTWYSSGSTYTGGGWSNERRLALTADGRYERGGESANTGGNGAAWGRNDASGTWDCVDHGSGVAVILRGDAGGVETLPIELTDKDDVILLGGQKWVLPP